MEPSADYNGLPVTYNSPVWRFIGVYTWRINKESDLGMFWKAWAVAELIASL